MLRAMSLPALLVALVLAGSAAQAEPAAVDLRSLLTANGGLRLAGRQLDRVALARLYEAHNFEPFWVSIPERETALRKALDTASQHGLDPFAFAVPDTRPDERDVLLTDAFLRYATALARGDVSAAEIETDWAFSPPPFAAETALDRAVRSGVGAVLTDLPPAVPGYKRLQAALARYDAIAAAGGWPEVPDGVKLKRGDSGRAVTALRRRLTLEGYLSPEAKGKDFDDVVVAAVRRFQARHGIAVDGAVGRDTFQALNVPAVNRVEQIRANLERWRELPREWPATRIEVNVPAATLQVIEHGEVGLTMRAIVGAEDHPTPALRARISAILFNPAWHIPVSIAKNEILPRAERDPRYLERNNYVRVGALLQQLPGPKNALGRVKFEMPNIFDVYLHDTPSHPLFSRVNRSLSHGCVRLEDPRRLALYVLGSQSGWAREDIDHAIDEGSTQRVALSHSIPVYLLYWTAFVDEDDAVEFRDDIYARDLRLLTALADREAAERLAPSPPAIPVTTADQTALNRT